jgi:hypothetical protein
VAASTTPGATLSAGTRSAETTSFAWRGGSGRRKRTFQLMPPCGAQGAKRSIFSASIALPRRLENKTATTTAAVVESILECRR